MIAELEIERENGVFCVAATDADWKVRRSPRWMAQVSRQHQWNGFREIYLAEQEDGWAKSAYDDSSWSGAVVIAKALDLDSPWPRLLPREIPPLHREWVIPAAIVRTEANFGVSLGSPACFGIVGAARRRSVRRSVPLGVMKRLACKRTRRKQKEIQVG